MGREHSPPRLPKTIIIVKAVGALTAIFLLVDLSVYLINESNRSLSREHARVLACYQNPGVKGCEREASVVRKHKEQLENEEREQRIEEEERLANEARKDRHKQDMTPICAAIARQHYMMDLAPIGAEAGYINSNSTWHDAGCRELFGGIRDSMIRSHSSLPSNWASMDFKGAFPEKCWELRAGDLAPCNHR